jgi:hypothetical protein
LEKAGSKEDNSATFHAISAEWVGEADPSLQGELRVVTSVDDLALLLLCSTSTAVRIAALKSFALTDRLQVALHARRGPHRLRQVILVHSS